jgi:hypothetical protein
MISKPVPSKDESRLSYIGNGESTKKAKNEL